MANAKDTGAARAIPSAGPDFEHLLAQEVVIEAGDAAPTGAQRVAPDHSPRARTGTVESAADALIFAELERDEGLLRHPVGRRAGDVGPLDEANAERDPGSRQRGSGRPPQEIPPDQ